MKMQKRFRELFRFREDIREKSVRVVVDCADTFWKLWRLLTDFKGTIRQKQVFGCVYTSNSNNLNIWKLPYLEKNSGVRVVVDYADTRFSNFAIEYFRENEKVRETVFACSYWA